MDHHPGPKLATGVVHTQGIYKYHCKGFGNRTEIRTQTLRDTWMAQAMEHATFDLRVVSVSPTVGVEITQK